MKPIVNSIPIFGGSRAISAPELIATHIPVHQIVYNHNSNINVGFSSLDNPIRDKFYSMDLLSKELLKMTRLTDSSKLIALNTLTDIEYFRAKMTDNSYLENIAEHITNHYINTGYNSGLSSNLKMYKSTSSLKILFSNALKNIDSGTILSNFNVKGSTSISLYSNYFSVSKIIPLGRTSNILIPLVVLIIRKEHCQDALLNMFIDKDLDPNWLEFWVDADFYNSTSAISVNYKKIMLPEIVKEGIAIKVKKSILVEFLQVFLAPKVPTFEDLKKYEEGTSAKFLEYYRKKFNLKFVTAKVAAEDVAVLSTEPVAETHVLTEEELEDLRELNAITDVDFEEEEDNEEPGVISNSSTRARRRPSRLNRFSSVADAANRYFAGLTVAPPITEFSSSIHDDEPF